MGVLNCWKKLVCIYICQKEVWGPNGLEQHCLLFWALTMNAREKHWERNEKILRIYSGVAQAPFREGSSHFTPGFLKTYSLPDVCDLPKYPGIALASLPPLHSSQGHVVKPFTPPNWNMYFCFERERLPLLLFWLQVEMFILLVFFILLHCIDLEHYLALNAGAPLDFDPSMEKSCVFQWRLECSVFIRTVISSSVKHGRLMLFSPVALPADGAGQGGTWRYLSFAHRLLWQLAACHKQGRLSLMLLIFMSLWDLKCLLHVVGCSAFVFKINNLVLN